MEEKHVFITSSGSCCDTSYLEKRKLFIGGLSWRSSPLSLKKYFTHFGDTLDCCIMVNTKTGKPRGFGFVTFYSDELVEHLLTLNHVIDGKEVEVKSCTPKALNRMIRMANDAVDRRKVFLGGIPHAASEAQLEKAFEQHFGQVEEAVVISSPDYINGRRMSRGFGFVTFYEENLARQAVCQHYIFFMGKQVEIKAAEPKNPCDFLRSQCNNFPILPETGNCANNTIVKPVQPNLPPLMMRYQPKQLLMNSPPPPRTNFINQAPPIFSIPPREVPMVIYDQNYLPPIQSRYAYTQPLLQRNNPMLNYFAISYHC